MDDSKKEEIVIFDSLEYAKEALTERQYKKYMDGDWRSDCKVRERSLKKLMKMFSGIRCEKTYIVIDLVPQKITFVTDSRKKQTEERLYTWFASTDFEARRLSEAIGALEFAVRENMYYGWCMRFEIRDGDLYETISGLAIRELTCSGDVLEYIFDTAEFEEGFIHVTEKELSWLMRHTKKIGSEVLEKLK